MGQMQKVIVMLLVIETGLLAQDRASSLPGCIAMYPPFMSIKVT